MLNYALSIAGPKTGHALFSATLALLALTSGCVAAVDDGPVAPLVAPLVAPGAKAEGAGLMAKGDFESSDEPSHPAVKVSLRGGFISPGDKTSPLPAPEPVSPEPSSGSLDPEPAPEPSGPLTTPDRRGDGSAPEDPAAPSGQALTATSSASTDDPTTDPDPDEPQPDEPQIGFPFGGGKSTGGTLPTTP